MPVEIMERTAADNEYFHREFHNSINFGVDYVYRKYGEDAVKEYLTRFALRFYAPLIEQIRKKGLPALEAHFSRLYAVERASDDISLSREGGRLTLLVKKCPAVAFIRQTGHTVSPAYVHTSDTVYQAIAGAGGLDYTMVRYDPETGAALHVFERK